MANAALSFQVPGYCLVNLKVKEASYNNVRFLIIKNLLEVLGHYFLHQHSHVEIPFGEPKQLLKLCGLTTANMPYPVLFANLMPDFK